MISSLIWALVVLVLAREGRQELHRRRQHRADEAQRMRMDLRAERVDLESQFEAVREEFSGRITSLQREVSELRAAVSPDLMAKTFNRRPA